MRLFARHCSFACLPTGCISVAEAHRGSRRLAALCTRSSETKVWIDVPGQRAGLQRSVSPRARPMFALAFADWPAHVEVVGAFDFKCAALALARCPRMTRVQQHCARASSSFIKLRRGGSCHCTGFIVKSSRR
eukprot:6180746-Pleurochrysis_carterae.AAC.2